MDRTALLNAALGGRYQVERELGSGGMATVYLAVDAKHHRKVAIKVLRDDLSASVGAERFLREIEIAAQLQHPNILPLLDSGDADGRLFYVMPFVEGHSLRTRLAREHELPVGEAVRLLVEIVDALAYAHARGVVHRDIKPDNIMLSGRHGLIADFGVARALSNATNGNQITSLGVALGTPSYMSPEQATADVSVDHRSDIYAVGVMAYELIAGVLPFTGTSPQKVLAAHVMETPSPLSKHRANVSAALESAVMRCLEKKPADRWQSADELLAALEPLATPSVGMAPTSARLAPVERRRSPLPVVAAVVAVAVLAGGAYYASRRVTPSLALGGSTQLTTAAGLQIHPALSPDGKLVAYAAGTSTHLRIFIEPVGGGRVLPLSDDTLALQTNPRWSPDGSQLLVLSNGGVSVAPALGGSLTPVVSGSTSPVKSADWSPDGHDIAFVRNDSLQVQPIDGGAPRFVASGVYDLSDCHWQPSGQFIACVAGNSQALRPGATFGNAAPSSIALFPASGGVRRQLTDHKSAHMSPTWSTNGDRLYFISDRDGTRDVYEVALRSDGSARNPEMRLTTGLNAQSLSLAGGHFVYSVYTARSNIWSIAIPARGVSDADAATQLTNSAQTVESLRASRDGQWLVFDAIRSGRADIYRMPIGGGAEERLVHESFDVFAPGLSPDDRLLAYHSWRTGNRNIEVKPLDGGPVELVTRSPAQESYPAWSPDGSALAFFDQLRSTVFATRRIGPGKWSEPTAVGLGVRPEWLSSSELVYVDLKRSSVRAHAVTAGAERIIYDSRGGMGRPIPDAVAVAPDGRTIYFKSHDKQGHASFWRIPPSGGVPQLLVRFPNPLHRSNRSDFSVSTSRFYFTFEDQQSNIWVANVTAP